MGARPTFNYCINSKIQRKYSHDQDKLPTFSQAVGAEGIKIINLLIGSGGRIYSVHPCTPPYGLPLPRDSKTLTNNVPVIRLSGIPFGMPNFAPDEIVQTFL